MGNTQRKDFDTTDTPAVTNPQWMKKVQDEWTVAKVTVPGTHQTMSHHGGSIAKCQSWPLKKQLKAGIRFLDIRCRHYQDGLPIHHGIVYQKANFDDVLQDCVHFLDGHHSEFILMRIKKEHTAEQNSESFGTTLNRYIGNYPSKRFWMASTWPTVAQARGKIVVLQDFAGPIMGVPYNSMDIDDKYKVPTLGHVEEKWDSVRTHLEEARDGDPDTTFLTYSSGASAGAYPNAVADRINSRLWDFIDGSRNRWGIIAMDFQGAELVQKIIAANFD